MLCYVTLDLWQVPLSQAEVFPDPSLVCVDASREQVTVPALRGVSSDAAGQVGRGLLRSGRGGYISSVLDPGTDM